MRLCRIARARLRLRFVRNTRLFAQTEREFTNALCARVTRFPSRVSGRRQNFSILATIHSSANAVAAVIVTQPDIRLS